MKIYGSNAEPVRPEPPRETPRSVGEPERASSTPQRDDQVQISDAGRALAAQAAAEPGEDLTPEQIAAIRKRILAGAYDSLDVIDDVARKMLAAGDI